MKRKIIILKETINYILNKVIHFQIKNIVYLICGNHLISDSFQNHHESIYS